MNAPMHLPEVENNPNPAGHYAGLIQAARGRGAAMPQIWHMLAYKPAVGDALTALTEVIMRAESPLSPGLRELIAAVTSQGNHCEF
jgi:alkylhydroperoxidase family enzyme